MRFTARTTVQPPVRPLYEADEHAWIAQQVAALREGRMDDLDCEHLVEFLDDMASRDRRELRSHFVVLLMHMLKVGHQPARLSGSWIASIVEQQDQIKAMLKDIPSIGQHVPRLYDDAYLTAVRRAAAETGTPVGKFPVTNPWSVDQALGWVFEYVPPEPDDVQR